MNVKKIYFIISISDKWLFFFFLSFIPFLLLFSSQFLLIFFVLTLSYLSRKSILFADISGRVFFPLLDVSEQNIFLRWGGGSACAPPAYTPVNLRITFDLVLNNVTCDETTSPLSFFIKSFPDS